ncbi:hypothetical protein HPB52_007933 [Rhipicephalus sanguineus]|uniref:Uncharacterized protein n=1 Tax=Rhipicephalus sanguineus TaxID=34632 RepID=A0A9D4PYM1_RHISA|nr:hypothetical protein HPB52_007933 [Rhipicephalus sanguineus]
MIWTKAFHELWRRLWLQSVRRHYRALGLEVLSAVLVARLAVPGSAPREKPQKLSMQAARLGPDAERPYAHAEPAYITTETVVYGPQNAETDALVKAAFPKAFDSASASARAPEAPSAQLTCNGGPVFWFPVVPLLLSVAWGGLVGLTLRVVDLDLDRLLERDLLLTLVREPDLFLLVVLGLLCLST